MSKFSDKQLQEILQYVEGGVCRSLEEVIEESLGIDSDELSYDEWCQVDEIICECAECGWTVPVDDCTHYDDDDLVCYRC